MSDTPFTDALAQMMRDMGEELLIYAAERWWIAQGCNCHADAHLHPGPYPNQGTVTILMEHQSNCRLAEADDE